jgi:hypothetical protein
MELSLFSNKPGVRTRLPMKRSKRTLLPARVAGALFFGGLLVAAGQEQKPGPTSPPPEHHVTRIGTQPTEPPPPVPPEEIIKHFSEKEEEFRLARPGYVSRKIIRVQEFADDGSSLGEYHITIEPAISSSGRPYDKVVDQTSSLKLLHFEPEDLGRLLAVPAFVLTPAQLAKYDLTYVGKEEVDEINCYLFRVKAKQVDRTNNYFEGLAWVDDRDLAVVKTYGKWINETGDVRLPNLPFTYFETYRENAEGKFWFPNYTRSDDSVRLKDREVRTRLTIRWSDFKPVTSTAKPSSPKSPISPAAIAPATAPPGSATVPPVAAAPAPVKPPNR